MTTIGDLALAYGLTEGEIEQRIYALAEQVHQHYCLQQGIVNNHAASRPDEHAAASILTSLSAADWVLMKRVPPVPVSISIEPFTNWGDDSVMGSWAEPDDTTEGR